jgi:hypothetical protein
MKTNEIRTDRKHSLTTPEHASVLYSTMSPFKSSPGLIRNPKGQKFFFEKREKKFKDIFLFP